MSEDLRRKDNEIMIGIQTDIKSLKKSQNKIQKIVEDLGATVTDYMQENQEEHTRLTRGLFGDDKFNEEGLVKKVDRHEETIDIVNGILSNARLLWTVASILGVATLKDLFEILKPIIEKVMAGN